MDTPLEQKRTGSLQGLFKRANELEEKAKNVATGYGFKVCGQD